MRFLAISNGFTSAIAKLFHPIVYAVAWSLAQIYGLIPNYGVAIAILTVIIMALLTPLTVKSTRSMIAMQRLQPELKRLQQKYKGPEHRTELNEEMMRLYKEEGVNPATGCITGLLQAPFLFILYSVIRGLSNVVRVNGKLVAEPKDIPHSTAMYHSIIVSNPPGALNTWGMNLALKPFSTHSSIWAAIPFFVLLAIAVGVQYLQMAQLNRRNPNKSQMSSQMLMFQRITPVLFAYIYFLVPAAAVIYMIFSSIIRIVTQNVIFGMDSKRPAARPAERTIPAAALAEGTAHDEDAGDAKDGGKVTPPPKEPSSKNGSSSARTPVRAAAAKRPTPPPSHPRSKTKRKRKAR
jgi:YidC/Oxa1 family membrane protein insertase